MSRTEKARIHQHIAHALSQGQTNARQRRIDIAGHLRKGGRSCLAASAKAHLELAHEFAGGGISFSETEDFSRIAIDAAKALPAGPERDELLYKSVELLLSITEVKWRGRSEEGVERDDIDHLAALAEEAAHRSGDQASQIRTTMLRGKAVMAVDGLEPGLVKLRKAVDMAREYGDANALYVARIEYGRQVSKRNLKQGLDILCQAEDMFSTDSSLAGTADPLMRHAHNLGEIQLGITLFDDGQLEVALDRLTRAADRLRSEEQVAELPIALNYLAQVQFGLGDFVAAEATLREALKVEEERGGASGWHAYNQALLAYLLVTVNPEHPDVLELMAQAYAENTETRLLNLMPIVRNLYVDVLLLARPETDAQREQAKRLARVTSDETKKSGMIRSEIAAYSLRSSIALREGDTNQALMFATQSMDILDQVGDMPALRTEEVLYRAALANEAAGRPEEAHELLGRARAKVELKASHISDPSVRERFLTEVPLNRAILASGKGDA